MARWVLMVIAVLANVHSVASLCSVDALMTMYQSSYPLTTTTCTGNVATGTVCEVEYSGPLVCQSSKCLASNSWDGFPLCGCDRYELDSITSNPYHAVPTPADDIVDKDVTVSWAVMPYSCADTTCTLSGWGSLPNCSPLPLACDFMQLVANGFSASAASLIQCQNANHVADGTTCSLVRDGRSCPLSKCEGGSWSPDPTAIKCSCDTADFTDVGYANGMMSASGCYNEVALDGEDCEMTYSSMSCAFTVCADGEWNPRISTFAGACNVPPTNCDTSMIDYGVLETIACGPAPDSKTPGTVCAYRVPNAAMPCLEMKCESDGSWTETNTCQACIHSATACLSDQECTSADPVNFDCNCVSPQTGTPATNTAATCTMAMSQDECLLHATSCTAQMQTCSDPDHNILNNWVCECVMPATGSVGMQQAAMCSLDECYMNTACSAASQDCVDVDVNVMGDWECRCRAPAMGSNAGAPAMCSVDECIANAATCTAASQDCVDGDTTVVGDWECQCRAPAVGSNTAAAAMCSLDECIANAATCTAASQDCVDGDTTVVGDWECQCRAPAVGSNTAAVAMCSVDECIANAATCTAASQDCVDGDMNVMGDWECQCRAPAMGSNTAAAAMCSLDECIANAATCTAASQDCVDGDTTVVGDWECQCRAPAMGSNTAAVAMCSVDECIANAATCTTASQDCVDGDMNVMGDWECQCRAPAMGSNTAAAAMCSLDECIANAATCTGSSQDCVDGDMNVMGDWECQCRAPAMGSNTGAPAMCSLDECYMNTACTAASQDCVDGDMNVMGDWECQCRAPAMGSNTGAPAMCSVDECIANAVTCTAASQDCVDGDTTVVGDWECQCRAPAMGSNTGASAMCYLDECTLYAGTCTAASQDCVDGDPYDTNYWQCECRAPAVGSNTGAPAMCSLDECIANAATCTGASQDCVDGDMNVMGDWECQCRAPAMGSNTGAPAMCSLDECYMNTACTAASQDCVDGDMNVMGDWECQCRAPAMGSNTGAPAMCSLDECYMNTACTAASQDCVDGDMNVMGDWECQCRAPAMGSNTAAPAMCSLDECYMNTACTAASQDCVDGDMNVMGDWECQCRAPAMGSNTGAPAMCSLDECYMNTACTAASQDCVDGDMNVMGDWECQCRAPAMGSNTAAPAMCSLDECYMNTACTAASQDCVDGDMNVMGDWECQCRAPAMGSNTGAPAMCSLDECYMNTACTAASQDCVDGDMNVMGDWECQCRAPAMGSNTGAPAMCSLDECYMNTACTAASQDCVDGDMNVMGDWECQCRAPAMGSNTAAPAMCSLDECYMNTACTAASQDCVDGDMNVMGDWECQCRAPAMGSNTAAPAMCSLDECYMNTACTAASQDCVDGDMNVMGDWECQCRAPAMGSNTGAPAMCSLDECYMNTACTAASQDCVDGDMNVMGDWECQCRAPAMGSNTAAPAMCSLDECYMNTACTAASQDCVDGDMNVMGDWECQCRAPAMGSNTGAPAMCSLDECYMNTACTAASQDCVDGDMNVMGDWECQCRAPAMGSNTGAPAMCSLDECYMNTACTAASQDCVDGDMNVMGDWECQCRAPAMGSNTGAPAMCSIDECITNAVTCTAAGQTCRDDDATNAGTWECVCTPPTVGVQLTGVAMCIMGVDECIANAATCTPATQDCVDNDFNTDDDWECVCRAPATGATQVAMAATCTVPAVDECVANGDTCTNADQDCVDKDLNALGDWECRCRAPGLGTQITGVVAICMVEECDTITACDAVSQDCVDPDKTMLGNWECRCRAPAVGSQALAPATCTGTVDECIANGPTCTPATQDCVDNDFNTDDDWECVCRAPATGATQVAMAATCTVPAVDECVANGDTCTNADQDCVDPDINALGDWECRCRAPGLGTQITGVVAICMVDECDTITACDAANQDCVDPDKTMLGNWECRCRAPAVGSQALAPATCTVPAVDECIANGATCTPATQDCVDNDFSTADDWECVCRAPATGATQVAMAATCTVPAVDECVANGDTCTNADQDCVDKDLNALGDWECRCRAPGLGTQITGVVAICMVEECDTITACDAVSQDCVDPDKTMLGNWECRCRAPAVGSQALAPATCTGTVDECIANGATCTPATQDCVDNDVNTADDWECVCRAPATGATQVAMAATCTVPAVDECVANGDTCTNADQDCVDPDTNTLGNWQCRCRAPALGAAGVTVPATCRRVGRTVAPMVALTFAPPPGTPQDTLEPATLVPGVTMAPATLVPAVQPVDCMFDDLMATANAMTDATCTAGAKVLVGVTCEVSRGGDCVMGMCTVGGWVENPCDNSPPSLQCTTGQLPCEVNFVEDNTDMAATGSKVTLTKANVFAVSPSTPAGVVEEAAQVVGAVCMCAVVAGVECSAALDTATGDLTVQAGSDLAGDIPVSCDLTDDGSPSARSGAVAVAVLRIRAVDDLPAGVVQGSSVGTVAVVNGEAAAVVDREWLSYAGAGPATAVDEAAQAVTATCVAGAGSAGVFVEAPTLDVSGGKAALRYVVSGSAAEGSYPVTCTLSDAAGSTVLPTYTVKVAVMSTTFGAKDEVEELRVGNVNSDEGTTLTFGVEGVDFAATGDVAFRVVGPDGEEVIVPAGGTPLLTITTDASPADGNYDKGLLALLQKGESVVTVTAAANSLVVKFKSKDYFILSPDEEKLSIHLSPSLYDTENDVCKNNGCTYETTLQADVPMQEGRVQLKNTMTAGVSTMAAATMISAAPSTSASKAGILAMASRAMLCPGDGPDKLDRTLNPLGLQIGTRKYQEYNGAVLGNLLINFALLAGCGIAALWLHRKIRVQRGRTFELLKEETACNEVDTKYVLLKARFGWLVMPLLFLYGGAGVGAMTALLYSTWLYKVLGAFLFIVFVVGFPYYVWKAVKGSKENAVYIGIEDAHTQGLKKDVLWGKEEWVAAPEKHGAHTWCMLHHLTYDGYRQKWRYFLLFELLVIFLLSGLTAWQPTNRSSCWTRALGMTIILGIFTLVLLIGRPYIAPYENVGEVLIALTETVMMVLTLIAMGSDNPADHWAAPVASKLGLVAMWLILCKFFADAGVFIKDEYDVWVDFGGEGGWRKFFMYWFFFQDVLKKKHDGFCELKKVATSEQEESLLEEGRSQRSEGSLSNVEMTSPELKWSGVGGFDDEYEVQELPPGNLPTRRTSRFGNVISPLARTTPVTGRYQTGRFNRTLSLASSQGHTSAPEMHTVTSLGRGGNPPRPRRGYV